MEGTTFGVASISSESNCSSAWVASRLRPVRGEAPPKGWKALGADHYDIAAISGHSPNSVINIMKRYNVLTPKMAQNAIAKRVQAQAARRGLKAIE